MIKFLSRLAALGATGAVLLAALSYTPTATAQGSSGTLLTAQDTSLLVELKANGYSADEIQQLQQLLENSRKYAQDLSLTTPPTKVEVVRLSDNVADRLALIGPEFAKLASLPSKSIEQATGVKAITPENIAQVLARVYTLAPDEKVAMYGDDTAKAAGAERTRNRQKTVWLERNLSRMGASDLAKACILANTFLDNAGHLSTDVARLMVSTALDFHAPAPDYGATPNAAQAITLANRPLNFTQSLAWMTALAKPGVAHRAATGEIIKVSLDEYSAYFITPDSLNLRIASLPDTLTGVTLRGLIQALVLQSRSIADGRKIAENKAVIAENKAVIAENKAESARLKKSAAQKEQHAFILSTTESVRTKALPLIAAYLGENPRRQQEIRIILRALAKQFREAEQITLKVEPLNEENRLAKEGSLQRIREMYVLIAKTGVDPTQ